MIIWYLSWASVSFSQVFHVEANMFICFRFYIRWGFQYSQSDKSIARTRCCSTFLPVFPGFYAVEANNFKNAVSSLYPMGISVLFSNWERSFFEWVFLFSFIHTYVCVCPPWYDVDENGNCLYKRPDAYAYMLWYMRIYAHKPVIVIPKPEYLFSSQAISTFDCLQHLGMARQSSDKFQVVIKLSQIY